MDTFISQIYEDRNFPGVDTLIKYVQKERPDITKSYIKKWYLNQLEIQLLHKKETKKTNGHVVAFPKMIHGILIFLIYQDIIPKIVI